MKHLEAYLTERKMTVEVSVGGALNLAYGRGPNARKATLLATEQLSERMASYADGVLAFMQESARSKASKWPFKRAAATLLPQVVDDAFLTGYRDIAGEDLVSTPLFNRISLAFRFQSELSYRLVPTSQLTLWGTTVDRVYAGARSMLFHHTDGAVWIDENGVKRLKKGDGHDAARAIVIEDFFYSEMTSTFMFSIPTADCLLASFSGDQAALQVATETAFTGSDAPVSIALLEFERGRVRVVQ